MAWLLNGGRETDATEQKKDRRPDAPTLPDGGAPRLEGRELFAHRHDHTSVAAGSFVWGGKNTPVCENCCNPLKKQAFTRWMALAYGRFFR